MTSVRLQFDLFQPISKEGSFKPFGLPEVNDESVKIFKKYLPQIDNFPEDKNWNIEMVVSHLDFSKRKLPSKLSLGLFALLSAALLTAAIVIPSFLAQGKAAFFIGVSFFSLYSFIFFIACMLDRKEYFKEKEKVDNTLKIINKIIKQHGAAIEAGIQSELDVEEEEYKNKTYPDTSLGRLFKSLSGKSKNHKDLIKALQDIQALRKIVKD